MRTFLALYESLDSTTSTNEKVGAMSRYFASADPADAAWALYLLSGSKIKSVVPRSRLLAWACAVAVIPTWLMEECVDSVGDTAETISLLAAGGTGREPAAAPMDEPLSVWIEQRIRPLRDMEPREQYDVVSAWWRSMTPREVFLLVKLLTGGLRIGVSRALVVRAVASAFSHEPSVIEARLMGAWEPSADAFRRLISRGVPADDVSRPYPFFLARPFEESAGKSGSAITGTFGAIGDWRCEWKYDGIRAQLIRRGGETHIWSRGEEQIADRFPEIVEASVRLRSGVVLDGELVVVRAGKVMPFAALQVRIGRLALTPKILASAPVCFIAFDLLELGGEDMRGKPLRERRKLLERTVSGVSARLLLAETLRVDSWDDAIAWRDKARARGYEGLMLKRIGSVYGQGRASGDWYKWKVDPYRADLVLTAAEPGRGRRASMLTDYTFSAWDGDRLVPVTRAYSGLSNAEIAELDRWLRANTTQRHGPVRSVEAFHVFEIGFEGIAESSRHRSGVSLRFPRILRWRKDKPVREADTLDQLRALIGPRPDETLAYGGLFDATDEEPNPAS